MFLFLFFLKKITIRMKLSTITGFVLWSYCAYSFGDTCRDLLNYGFTEWMRIWGKPSFIMRAILSVLMLVVGAAFIFKNKFVALKGGIILVILLPITSCLEAMRFPSSHYDLKDFLNLLLHFATPVLQTIVLYYLIRHPLNHSELETNHSQNEDILDME